MRGYLRVVGVSSSEVPVESTVGIYRDPDETQRILAATPDRVHELGVADPTVSRKRNGQAPIEVVERENYLEVRNERNTNGVVVRADGDETRLEKGQVKRIRGKATLEVGYQTKLLVTVERDPKVEVHGGDYVAGDKSEERTVVEDSVINRSDVGGSPSADPRRAPTKRERHTSVEDSVVNRSSVGDGTRPVADSAEPAGSTESAEPAEPAGSTDSAEPAGSTESAGAASSDDSDTKEFCERHQRAYTDVCPECASGGGSAGAGTGSDPGTNAPETKFCMYCGTEIPRPAGVCPACDEEL